MLVASGAELALQAADAARPPVPIVMLANNFDPIARGYVKSLSHPGGNITGLVYRQPELAAKQLELLAQAFPGRTRVGLLWDQYSVDGLELAERVARSLRLTLRPLKLENPPYDWDAAFRNLSEREAEMLLVLSSPLFTPHRARIAELAVRHRLPSMYIFRYYVTAGGLISYGVNTGPYGDARPLTLQKFCGVHNPPICRWNRPRISSWRSISRPLRRSAWKSRPRSCCRADEVIE